MTKKQRAATVMQELEKLYPQVPVPLDHYSSFTLLVAVALSAQTTDKSVNLVTPELFRRADTPKAMAAMEVEEIKEYLTGLGLGNQKAKNLKKMAEDIVEKFGGEVPDNYEDLESLAGVGHKTASVVMSQAFGHPAFPVDTHIHRLMKKWKLSRGKNVTETERDAKQLFPRDSWNKLHLQIIYYGREYAPARGSSERDFITTMLFQ